MLLQLVNADRRGGGSGGVVLRTPTWPRIGLDTGRIASETLLMTVLAVKVPRLPSAV